MLLFEWVIVMILEYLYYHYLWFVTKTQVKLGVSPFQNLFSCYPLGLVFETAAAIFDSVFLKCWFKTLSSSSSSPLWSENFIDSVCLWILLNLFYLLGLIAPKAGYKPASPLLWEPPTIVYCLSMLWFSTMNLPRPFAFFFSAFFAEVPPPSAFSPSMFYIMFAKSCLFTPKSSKIF